MSFAQKILICAALIITIITAVRLFRTSLYRKLPKVAIPIYSSLQATIEVVEEGLAHHDLKKNQHITLEVMDVIFEPTLIMQMLAKLKASNPQVIVTLTTPVSQAANRNLLKVVLEIFLLCLLMSLTILKLVSCSPMNIKKKI